MTDTSSNTDVPYIWNEDAEIEFVLMEEEAPPESLHSKREDIIHRMMHGRLLNPQIRRSRHIPGLIYAPAVLAGWVAKPAQSLASTIEQYKRGEHSK